MKKIEPGMPCLVIGSRTQQGAINIGAQLTVTQRCPNCKGWHFADANRPLLIGGLRHRFTGEEKLLYARSSEEGHALLRAYRTSDCIAYVDRFLMPLVGDPEPEPEAEKIDRPEEVSHG